MGDPSIPAQVLEHIPREPACKDALDTGFRALPQPIFNHSLRVFLFARWLADKESSGWTTPEKLPLLFVACMCHDFGACDLYNGQQRFEVEGADAATTILDKHGVSAEDQQQVWNSIALHTSAGIAERIKGIVRLTRIAVKIDFSSDVRAAYGAVEYGREVEAQLPRLGIEKVLADAVVHQAGKISRRIDAQTYPDSQKHPKASWPGILLRAHLENPDHDGVNFAF